MNCRAFHALFHDGHTDGLYLVLDAAQAAGKAAYIHRHVDKLPPAAREVYLAGVARGVQEGDLRIILRHQLLDRTIEELGHLITDQAAVTTRSPRRHSRRCYLDKL